MSGFDDAYGGADTYFGGQPEPILIDHLGLLNVDLPALDIGCGQGRNALFLDREGFAVDALDPSAVAIGQVSRTAVEHDLKLRTIQGTFLDKRADDGHYGTVLAFGLIPLLDRAEISDLISMVTRSLAGGGFLFVTAFGTWDPAYPMIASEWRELGPRSFRGPLGDVRTYLEPGELRLLFSDLEVIHSWEGLGPEHRHGSSPVERHGMAEAILRR